MTTENRYQEFRGGEKLEVKVNQSRKQRICIIYHPNPDSIEDAVAKVREALKEA